jgi:signal recognition particle subunit SRP54
MIRRMGSLRDIIGHLPFIGSRLEGIDFDDKQVNRIEAIINSMTRQELINPEIITAGRRQRIADGSGNDPVAVNQLLKQFRQMKKMLRKLSKGNVDAISEMLPPGLDTADELAPTHGGKSKSKSRRSRRRRRK